MATTKQYRDEAAAHRQEAADSFERSDTDGFASQAASGIMARLADAKADLAEEGNVAEFPALFNLDGTVASTHHAHGKWGEYYVLNDEATERYGKRFFTPSKAEKVETRRKNNRAKGFTEGTIRAAAYADTYAPESARGFGGMASVAIVVKPVVADLLEGKFEVITTEA